MKAGGIVLVVVAVLMILGTVNELYFSGPWFLRWLDIRWWWHWIATGYTWIDSVVDIDFHSPDCRSGQ
ncbi:MAG TPA: hypothetical protein DEW39_09875 [Brevibacterium sp.]|uniref:Uncharacterized protein n=1 Tax=Brevibacterium antiquum CNRZ 918 TaxID=1255637 RepID=A0A2H1J2Z6_9MICO|nr:hypothetical protein BANT918_01377 [Brevibacterium antiquum CNRZ 918]HCG56424.1 hypothetical protein [Brevibacterium sp.]